MLHTKGNKCIELYVMEIITVAEDLQFIYFVKFLYNFYSIVKLTICLHSCGYKLQIKQGDSEVSILI